MSIKYPEVFFAKINAVKAKFFVTKLNVQVLPAVMCFKDGILKHKLIGFEMFGNVDNFPTKKIERKLWKFTFLTRPAGEDLDSDSENEEEDGIPTKKPSLFRQAQRNNDSDSDSD